MKKKKVLFTVGIRPDGSKISPLYKTFKDSELYDTILVNTGQHGNLLREMLDIFEVQEDYNLNTMRTGQSLSTLTGKILLGLSDILEKEKPDLVFAPNDGTTTLVTALAAYYYKIPVAHVEAGLRTDDIYNPFPEEGNRKMTSAITSYHFSPTPWAKQNLLKENVDPRFIFTTGNTTIDSLYWVVEQYKNFVFDQPILNKLNYVDKKIILVTTHRRENWGSPMKDALMTVKKLARENKNVEVVFPVHPNPIVRDLAWSILGGQNRIYLLEPLNYIALITLLKKCYCVLSDSGGIQEEAPSFGKPMLVMRKTTERPEGIEAGVSKLVGTDPQTIYNEVTKLLRDDRVYKKMSHVKNPYGDGKACQRIFKRTSYYLGLFKSSPHEFKSD